MATITLGLLLFCAGSAMLGGFIDAIAGGGGLITIPALLIAGVPPHHALAVNKVSACTGTSVAVCVFARHGLVRWRIAIPGCLFSIMGTWAGSTLALCMDSAILGKILVLLLPIGMCATLLPRAKNDYFSSCRISGLRFYLLLPAICLVIGAYDGFFGPGTGSFLIIALHWVLLMPLIMSSATAKVLNLASNMGGAAVFIMHGQVLWPLAFPMIFGGVAGNWLGSRLAIRVGAKAVRRFLTVSLALLLVTLLWQYFLNPARAVSE